MWHVSFFTRLSWTQGQLGYSYSIQTVLAFPPECVDLSHIQQQQQRGLDGGLRTAGSDKHNQPQQYSANECVAHARRMGGGVVTLCSVHVVRCLPGTCGLCARESAEPTRYCTAKNGKKIPVRAYKIRPLVLKPGKLPYQLPPKESFRALVTRCTLHGSRPDLDQRVRSVFPRRPLSFSPKSAHTKSYVRKNTIISHIMIPGIVLLTSPYRAPSLF